MSDKPQATRSALRTPLSVYSELELQAQRDAIVGSGALGRSRVYEQLLDHLLQAAREGRQPKEVELAIDVLGRGSDFDVGKDSVVRVYMHQLRKRLHSYYEQYAPNAESKLVIPKGQYTIAVQQNRVTASPETAPAALAPGSWKSARMARPAAVLAAILIAALLLNALLLLNDSRDPPDTTEILADHPMWQPMFDDDLPVLMVMGDYYIFGELDEFGRVERMVREFDINSRDDLTERFMRDSDSIERYRDLDMTYMPEGSAYALTHIAPLLRATGKRMRVTMMSRLSTADLRNNHIIYIGYISALDKLNNLYFAASGLQLGRSYDELYDRRSQRFYTSDAGLPDQGQAFRDIGLLATFPAANRNQFVLITGTRDAGVMHSAQVATDPALLRELDDHLHPREDFASLEALYEVFGLDRMNFDANLLYSETLDPARIWRRQQQ